MVHTQHTQCKHSFSTNPPLQEIKCQVLKTSRTLSQQHCEAQSSSPRVMYNAKTAPCSNSSFAFSYLGFRDQAVPDTFAICTPTVKIAALHSPTLGTQIILAFPDHVAGHTAPCPNKGLWTTRAPHFGRLFVACLPPWWQAFPGTTAPAKCTNTKSSSCYANLRACS